MLRKKTWIITSTAVTVILTSVISWRSLQANSDHPSRQLEELDQKTVQAQNRFGLQVWAQLTAKNPQQNVVISPYSISTALSMTLDGAAGKTEEAMRKTMQLDGVPADMVKQNALVLSDLITHSGKGIELTTANSLWLQKDFRFVDQFLKDARHYYNAKVTSLDLPTPTAMDRINEWVKSNTGGKIAKILEEPPTNESRLVLVNVVYFKGEWAKPFSKSATKDGVFHLTGGSTKTASFMSQSDSYGYMETSDFQAVRLPYRGDRMDMIVLVPRVDKKLEDIRANLIDHPETWLMPYPDKSGTVELPRFKLEYGDKLNDALIALGMGVAFDREQGDFRRIAPAPPNLYIASVDHKTYIEVDEKGTKAAAATSIGLKTVSAVSTKPFQFRADRPFLIVIQDRLTNAILFTGSIYDPGLFETGY